MQTFFIGLHANTQIMVDATGGGLVNCKTPNEVYDLLKMMASNDYRRASDWNTMKVSGLMERDIVRIGSSACSYPKTNGKDVSQCYSSIFSSMRAMF